MFNQQEAQILLGGVNSPVDLDDLRKHTNYSGVYGDDEETIVSFWNASALWRIWSFTFISNECCRL